MRRAKACTNCGNEKVYVRDLCAACYDYKRRHNGADRPPAGVHASVGPCTDCGRTGPYNDVKLKVCYVCKRYRRTHGGQPRVVVNGRVDVTKPYNKGPCTNCGRTGLRLTKGLCPACFTYQYNNNGAARPVNADGTLRQRARRKNVSDDVHSKDIITNGSQAESWAKLAATTKDEGLKQAATAEAAHYAAKPADEVVTDDVNKFNAKGAPA